MIGLISLPTLRKIAKSFLKFSFLNAEYWALIKNNSTLEPMELLQWWEEFILLIYIYHQKCFWKIYNKSTKQLKIFLKITQIDEMIDVAPIRPLVFSLLSKQGRSTAACYDLQVLMTTSFCLSVFLDLLACEGSLEKKMVEQTPPLFDVFAFISIVQKERNATSATSWRYTVWVR